MSPRIEYEEFEIEIRSIGENRFEARVLSSPKGRATEVFSPPLSTTELSSVLRGIELRIRQRAATFGARDVVWRRPDGEELRPFDERVFSESLYASLFKGQIDRRFSQGKALLEGGEDTSARRGLRIRLSFDREEDFALLATLPWEFMSSGQDALALDPRTPIVRSVLAERRVYSAVPLPLRVLLVDSQAHAPGCLDTAREREVIRKALGFQSEIKVILLERPDIRDLREALKRERCHILHFMGHGNFDWGQEKDPFVLLFEAKSGQHEQVDGDLLASYIRDSPNLRLVVLNACWGGAFPRHEGQNPFCGVAASLMRAGLPAVVAMQQPISDRAAIAFSGAFYHSLASGESVATAVTEGRLEIRRGDKDGVEWATPVLFLAANDNLFDISAPREAASTKGSVMTEEQPLYLEIKSFTPAFLAHERQPDDQLDLTGFFEGPDGRYIRHPELWRAEVFPRLRDFLFRYADTRRPIVIDFAAHSTLAYAAGYCLELKSGLDITILQRGIRGVVRWHTEAGPTREGDLWIAEADHPRVLACQDVALALSVTWEITEDVEGYLDRAGIQVGRLLPMTVAPAPDQTVVADGLHALQLAQSLVRKIRRRTHDEREATLHLFASAPNSLLFFLGQYQKGLGTVQLYEHDAKNLHPPLRYEPSLRLPLS